MVTETSLQALPDPDSIVDEATASEALHSTLAAVATANHKLANAPKEAQMGGHHRDWAAFHDEIMSLFRDLHELLPKIASFRALSSVRNRSTGSWVMRITRMMLGVPYTGMYSACSIGRMT